MLGLKKIGGQRVKAGNYWNLATGERIHIDEGGALPGDAGAVYYKLHPAVMLFAAPVLGLIYAVFLPFIGIAMLFVVAFRKVFGGAAESLWRGASFGWKPSEAYLAGKKHKKGKKEEDGAKGKKESEVERKQ
jgi:hypothetical protein